MNRSETTSDVLITDKGTDDERIEDRDENESVDHAGARDAADILKDTFKVQE